MEFKLAVFALALLLLHIAVASPVAPTLEGTKEGSGRVHIPIFFAPAVYIVSGGKGGKVEGRNNYAVSDFSLFSYSRRHRKYTRENYDRCG